MRGRAFFGIVACAGSLALAIVSCVGDDPSESGTGAINGPCYANGSCNADLVCVDGVCRSGSSGGIEGGSNDGSGGNETGGGNDTGGGDTSLADSTTSDADQSGAKTYRATLINNYPDAATGTAVLTHHSDGGKMCGTLTWMKLSSNFGSAHIHEGVVTQTGPNIATFSMTGPTSATVSFIPSGDQVVKAIDQGLYVDVHSSAFPGPNGEIRGQIKPDPNGTPQPCP